MVCWCFISFFFNYEDQPLDGHNLNIYLSHKIKDTVGAQKYIHKNIVIDSQKCIHFIKCHEH